jgi:hypothetical protein
VESQGRVAGVLPPGACDWDSNLLEWRELGGGVLLVESVMPANTSLA